MICIFYILDAFKYPNETTKEKSVDTKNIMCKIKIQAIIYFLFFCFLFFFLAHLKYTFPFLFNFFCNKRMINLIPFNELHLNRDLKKRG